MSSPQKSLKIRGSARKYPQMVGEASDPKQISKHMIISGWWLTYPSEKWWSSSVGMMKFPIYGKIFQTTNQNKFQIIRSEYVEVEQLWNVASVFLSKNSASEYTPRSTCCFAKWQGSNHGFASLFCQIRIATWEIPAVSGGIHISPQKTLFFFGQNHPFWTNHLLLNSMDWFSGTFTGKPHISW